MMSKGLVLSEKYKSFLKCKAEVEFLEGTTSAGKTTVGIFKFMLKVAESSQKYHIIASEDIGTAEKNIINKDLGILDVFGILVEYNGNGTRDEKIPHLIFETEAGTKTIYVMGYGNKQKWKKALGGQYGCLYVDEINTADIEFVREASMRCDYFMGTLNPDDPNLSVYEEYINHARPLEKWRAETPKEILRELKQEPKPGWVHWFFSFKDNLGLPKEKLDKIIRAVPKGTKLYKNKVQGLRGRATGLVFTNFDRSKHVISKEWLKQQVRTQNIRFAKFSAGLDTSYSQMSEDTIAMIFQGITTDGKLITIAEKVYSNKNLKVPLAPSDTATKFIDFLDECGREWGIAKDVFIDNADQGTITELLKYKRKKGCLYKFNNSYKKIKIVDRINLQLGWIQQGCYLVCEECTEHIGELERYSWQENRDMPEDSNDHTINASQYSWIPYRFEIGEKNSEVNG